MQDFVMRAIYLAQMMVCIALLFHLVFETGNMRVGTMVFSINMTIVVRYVKPDTSEIYKRFLTYVGACSLDAKSMTDYTLNKYQLDLHQIVFQGFDGASVMSKRCTGVLLHLIVY